MTSPQIPLDGPLDEPDELVPDPERTVEDDAADDALPNHLDVDPETPVPDVIDQRRSVDLDDDAYR